MNEETKKFKAARIIQHKNEVRHSFGVARDIVRFLRDDCTARQNQSALLMYLEKCLTDMLRPLDMIENHAQEIHDSDPNEPEDLPF